MSRFYENNDTILTRITARVKSEKKFFVKTSKARSFYPILDKCLNADAHSVRIQAP